jgi:hypothetical protein
VQRALDVVLVSVRTNKATVGGVLACETPCGDARYVGSGLSKYEGMRCTSRWERISGNPIITSIQLSITLASMLFKILSDFVTSLKKVKSNTTVPYIELLNCVPAKPTSDVGMSCLLDRALCTPMLLLLQPLRYLSVDKRGISTRVKQCQRSEVCGGVAHRY